MSGGGGGQERCAACGMALRAGSAGDAASCSHCAAPVPLMEATTRRIPRERVDMPLVAGRYRILGLLGRGGYAQVHEAEDLVLRRTVALKLLDADVDLPELERECRALARLQHPNVVTIHDVVADGSTLAITMELVSGSSLASMLAEPMAWPEAAAIGRQVAAGLRHAHDRGVVHGDIKPSNVLVDARGHAKVSDFGTARFMESVSSRRSSFHGTVAYAAPEVLNGARAGVASDVHSLGCLLHEMLSGCRPYSAATTDALVASILRDAPPSLSALGIDLPSSLEALVSACLAKDPARRPPSVAHVESVLASLCDTSGSRGALRRIPADLRASASGAAIPGERRTIVVLAVERRHHDELSEDWSPDSFARLREQEERVILSAARSHGALVDDVEETRLAFGLLRASEHDPLAAAACARQLLRALREAAGTEAVSRLAFALHVVRTAGGSDDSISALPASCRREIAAALRAAGDDEIVATESFVAAARGRFVFQPIGRVATGRRTGDELPVARLVGEAAPPSRDLPMAGRTHELGLLLEASERAEAGHGGFVSVDGLAGLGKSRLLAEVSAALAERGFLVVSVECRPGVLAGHAQPLGEIHAALEASGAVGRIATRLPEGDAIILAAHASGQWGNVAVGADPKEREAAVRVAWQRLVAALSAESPVALLVDDAHLLDERQTQSLVALADSARRVLIVAGHRPMADAPWREAAGHVALALRPLTPRQAAELLRSCLGGEPDPGLSQFVQERVDGVPLFALELARHLRESGAIAPDAEGRLSLHAPPSVSWPSSLEAVVASRMDQLPPTSRLLLQAGAILGREFDLGLAARVLDDEGLAASPEDLAAEPARRSIIEWSPRSAVARFAHAIVFDVVHDAMTRARRRVLHGRAARALAEGPGPNDLAREDRLAHHWSLSDEPARAAAHLEGAAARLEENGELREARRRLLSLLDGQATVGALDERHVAAARLRIAEWSIALDEPEQAWSFAEPLLSSDDVETSSRATVPAGRALHALRRGDEALALLASASARADGLEDADLRARIGMTRSLVLHSQGRGQEAASCLETAATSASSPRTRAEIARQRTNLLYHAGRADDAIGANTEALALAHELGDRSERARLLSQRCTVLVALHRHAEAREAAREALDIAKGLGMRLTEAHCASLLVNLCAAEGRAVEAQSTAAEAVALARAIGSSWALVVALRNHGTALHDLGRLDEASRVLEEGLSLASPLGERMEAGARVALAQLRLSEGSATAAEAEARAAIDLAAGQGASVRVLEASVLLAEALRAQGRFDEAADALGRAESVPASARDVDCHVARVLLCASAGDLDGATRWLELLERLPIEHPGERIRLLLCRAAHALLRGHAAATELVAEARETALRHGLQALARQALALGAAASGGPGTND